MSVLSACLMRSRVQDMFSLAQLKDWKQVETDRLAPSKRLQADQKLLYIHNVYEPPPGRKSQSKLFPYGPSEEE